MRTIGCILAGGRSSRFGADKAFIELQGLTLLERVIARLTPQVDELIINTASADQRFAKAGLPLVADAAPDFDGPLAGVLAGLRWAGRLGADAVVTSAVDTPLFPENVAQKLADQADGGIAAAESKTGLHPTFALWPICAEPALASWLASGQSRKMSDFLRSQRFKPVFFADDGPLDPFFNINTPADLAAVSAYLSYHPAP